MTMVTYNEAVRFAPYLKLVFLLAVDLLIVGIIMMIMHNRQER